MITILATVLISQMGSDDFKTRELAHKKLEQVLPLAAPHLLHARTHKDPEIAARAGRLYDKWAWQIALTIKPTRWPHLPWIDSLPTSYPERGQTIDGYLSLVGAPHADNDGNGPPHWPKYRQATQMFIHRQLLQGKTVAEVRVLLDDMADYEKGWIKKHQHSFKFPQEVLAACD